MLQKLVKLPQVSSRLQTRLVTTKVMYYLRYIRHFKLVASEVGPYSSDVLAINKNKYVTEVEVKVSWPDFRHEFKKELHYRMKKFKKHEIYANATSPWVPNYYFFAVPEELSDKVVAYLDKTNSKYGVIKVDNGKILNGFNTTQCLVVKSAKRLHTNVCSEKLLDSVIARMSSEVIQRRTNLCDMLYNKEIDDQDKEV